VFSLDWSGLLENGVTPPAGLKLSLEEYQAFIDKLSFEPSIQDVQRMAIDYNEVDEGKIKHWRRASQRKALLPTLSVGIDREATELFHWDTGVNPDQLRKGRTTWDWDVSLAWDFSDLIWNNDQTSIDSRSKLMVELREDILDQVTRLYFERKRLQVELASTNNPEEYQVEKHMRLEELTALIDSLTGGEFSQRIKEGHSE
jgi:hypothetical protein